MIYLLILAIAFILIVGAIILIKSNNNYLDKQEKVFKSQTKSLTEQYERLFSKNI